ncbi:MAG: DUF3416 domain-containing protein, partial [Thermoplasmata archaeon]
MNVNVYTISIEKVSPEIDCGRYPVKREVGERFEVLADIIKPGHNEVSATIKYRHKSEETWNEATMQHFDNDRWVGSFTLKRLGNYEYTIEAWFDRIKTMA